MQQVSFIAKPTRFQTETTHSTLQDHPSNHQHVSHQTSHILISQPHDVRLVHNSEKNESDSLQLKQVQHVKAQLLKEAQNEIKVLLLHLAEDMANTPICSQVLHSLVANLKLTTDQTTTPVPSTMINYPNNIEQALQDLTAEETKGLEQVSSMVQHIHALSRKLQLSDTPQSNIQTENSSADNRMFNEVKLKKGKEMSSPVWTGKNQIAQWQHHILTLFFRH